MTMHRRRSQSPRGHDAGALRGHGVRRWRGVLRTRAYIRLGVLLAVSIAMLLAGTQSTMAWKPDTHMFSANLVIQDIQDGAVTLPTRDGGEKQYPVDPRVAQAIKEFPEYYRAGVVGPDALPDIVFGQRNIHTEDGGYSDEWLRHVYREGWQYYTARCGEDLESDPCIDSPRVLNFEALREGLWGVPLTGLDPSEAKAALAFTYGFLTHAAGDMWGHTFINEFAGGPFPPAADVLAGGEARKNAARHIIVKGYVGEHTPDMSLSERALNAPNDFVYQTFIDNAEARQLAPGALFEWFLDLKQDIDDFREEIEKPEVIGLAIVTASIVAFNTCVALSAGLGPVAIAAAQLACPVVVAAASGAAIAGAIAGLNDWSLEIDKGLRDWVQMSEDVAIQFFTYGDVDEGIDITTLWLQMRVPLMLGEGQWKTVADIIGWLTFGPLYIAADELVKVATGSLTKWSIDEAFGISIGEWKDYFSHPESYINSATLGLAADTSDVLDAKMNVDGSGQLDPGQGFAALYNTTLTSKLLLLDHEALNQFLFDHDVGPLYDEDDYPNFMLGFMRSLDGNHQWRKQPPAVVVEGGPEWQQTYGNGMRVWVDCLARERVFRALFIDWQNPDNNPFPTEGDACEPIGKLPPVTVSPPRVIGATGEELTEISGCSTFGVTSELRNHQGVPQEFAYYVTVEHRGSIVYHRWSDGTVKPWGTSGILETRQTFSPEVVAFFDGGGVTITTVTITAYVFEKIAANDNMTVNVDGSPRIQDVPPKYGLKVKDVQSITGYAKTPAECPVEWTEYKPGDGQDDDEPDGPSVVGGSDGPAVSSIVFTMEFHEAEYEPPPQPPLDVDGDTFPDGGQEPDSGQEFPSDLAELAVEVPQGQVPQISDLLSLLGNLEGSVYGNPADNCLLIFNQGQEDSDGDGVGDLCEKKSQGGRPLTVKKGVINDGGGTAVPADVLITVHLTGRKFTFAGSVEGTAVRVPTGDYWVSETGPSGYSASQSAGCAFGALETASVSRLPLGPRTCVITNVVIDDDGLGARPPPDLLPTGSSFIVPPDQLFGRVINIPFLEHIILEVRQADGSIRQVQIMPSTQYRCAGAEPVCLDTIRPGDRIAATVIPQGDLLVAQILMVIPTKETVLHLSGVVTEERNGALSITTESGRRVPVEFGLNRSIPALGTVVTVAGRISSDTGVLQVQSVQRAGQIAQRLESQLPASDEPSRVEQAMERLNSRRMEILEQTVKLVPGGTRAAVQRNLDDMRQGITPADRAEVQSGLAFQPYSGIPFTLVDAAQVLGVSREEWLNRTGNVRSLVEQRGFTLEQFVPAVVDLVSTRLEEMGMSEEQTAKVLRRLEERLFQDVGAQRPVRRTALAERDPSGARTPLSLGAPFDLQRIGTTLNLSPEELDGLLSEGHTVATIAELQGVPLEELAEELTTSVRARLNEQARTGRLSPRQLEAHLQNARDSVLQRLKTFRSPGRMPVAAEAEVAWARACCETAIEDMAAALAAASIRQSELRRAYQTAGNTPAIAFTAGLASHLNSLKEELDALKRAPDARSANAAAISIARAADSLQTFATEENVPQEQRRAVQVMSDLMKSLHDTAKAIVRNMRA